MVDGARLTVTTAVAAQPPVVYDITAVPGTEPLTVPVPPVPETVAVPVADELHEPPPVVLLSVDGVPMHMFILPVMAAGDALTVMLFVWVQPLPSE